VTATDAPRFALDAPVHHPTLLDVIRSEWLKLRSVRSTFWSLAVVVVAMVGFGALICWAQVATIADQPEPIDGTESALAGLLFAQLAMVVLGVMAITAEFTTGGIRSTLLAVPRRGRLVVAKALVVGVTALVVGTAASFAAFFVGQVVLATERVHDSIGDPGVLRAVAGSGLYLAACALLGLGVGLLVRSTGGGVTAAVALLFVVPPLTFLIPGRVGEEVQKYVTANAGRPITQAVPDSGQLGPWVGYLVFTLWWVVLVAVGAWLLKRRDV
jgi:ABC-2 type transport system permease protein